MTLGRYDLGLAQLTLTPGRHARVDVTSKVFQGRVHKIFIRSPEEPYNNILYPLAFFNNGLCGKSTSKPRGRKGNVHMHGLVSLPAVDLLLSLGGLKLFCPRLYTPGCRDVHERPARGDRLVREAAAAAGQADLGAAARGLRGRRGQPGDWRDDGEGGREVPSR